MTRILGWTLVGIVAFLLLVTGNLPGQPGNGPSGPDTCTQSCDGWMP